MNRLSFHQDKIFNRNSFVTRQVYLLRGEVGNSHSLFFSFYSLFLRQMRDVLAPAAGNADGKVSIVLTVTFTNTGFAWSSPRCLRRERMSFKFDHELKETPLVHNGSGEGRHLIGKHSQLAARCDVIFSNAADDENYPLSRVVMKVKRVISRVRIHNRSLRRYSYLLVHF